MFTIFGATGNTGSIVAQQLLAQGKPVRVVGRDPGKLAAFAGAEAVVGDVTDAATVAKALAGAEGAYLMLPPDNANPDLIARNKLVTRNYLAGLKGVKHVAVLSSVGAERASGTGPIVTAHDLEVALKEAGQQATVIRAAYFMENILQNAHPIRNDGVLPVLGGGEGYPFPMVATKDIGETAADALLHPGRDSYVELSSGPTDYSFDDAAQLASEIVGRPVKTVVVPIEAVVPTLLQFGFSPSVAGLYREMVEAFASGLAFEGKGRRVRGHTTLADVLRAGLA
ncbi:MAG: NmrA family NAD(P)-binding protein [Kofleriaceae bacterium]